MNLLKGGNFIAGGDYSTENKKKYWTDDHIFFSNPYQDFLFAPYSQRTHIKRLPKHTELIKSEVDSHWEYSTYYQHEITTGNLAANNFFSCWVFYPHDRVASQNGEDAGTYLTKKMDIGTRRIRDRIKKRFIPITEMIETAKEEAVQYLDGETFWFDMLYFSRVKLRIPSMVTYHSLSSTRIQNSWIMYDKLNYSSNPDGLFLIAQMNTTYTKPLRFKKWQLMHFNIFLHNCLYNSIQNTPNTNMYEMFNEYTANLFPILSGNTNMKQLNTLFNIHFDKKTKSFMKLPMFKDNKQVYNITPSILHKQTLNALDVFWRLWIMQGTWKDSSNNMMGYREPIRIKDYRSQHTFKNGNKSLDKKLMEYQKSLDDDYNNMKPIYNGYENSKTYLNTISRGYKPYNNDSDFLISYMGTGLGHPVNTDAMGCGFNADSTITQAAWDNSNPWKLERWMYGKNRYQADFLWSINSNWNPSFQVYKDWTHKWNSKNFAYEDNIGTQYMGDNTLFPSDMDDELGTGGVDAFKFEYNELYKTFTGLFQNNGQNE